MPRGKIYFGTQGYMQWVPAPDRNVARGGHGWSSRSDRLNGTASVRRSAGNHKEYDFTWSTQKREAIDPVLAYANGDYGDGNIYWVDPWAAETNIAPDFWASPWKAGVDGINLMGKGTTKPDIVNTPTNSNGYPSRSARYTFTTPVTPRATWFPIPDGYTLHLGAHGSTTGIGRVSVQHDAVGAPLLQLPMISETSTSRTNMSFPGGAEGGGVTVSLEPLLTGGGTVTLSALIAILLPTGQSPAPGGWMTGQGNSGCQFSEPPTDMGYIKNKLNSLSVISATLVEVDQ